MYQEKIDELTPIVNSIRNHAYINQRAKNAQEYPSAQLRRKCGDLESVVTLLDKTVEILERLARQDRKGLLP